MKKTFARFLVFIIISSMILTAAGCGSTIKGLAEQGQYVIEAKEVVKQLEMDNTVLVDTQKASNYINGHIKDSVNIPLDDIVINDPVPNLIAPPEKIERILSKNGINNNNTVIIYDNNKNMEAARLWWTLIVYGHEKIKVVSGGFNALKSAKLEVTDTLPPITQQEYKIQTTNTMLLATFDDVKAQINEPEENIILLDTRTPEEFAEGTIPGSILFDFNDNNFSDDTVKPVDHMVLNYVEKGITPDKTVIMYCKTSVRAAQTFLALYNAGYRNLKLYDGAWVEYSADKSFEAQKPEEKQELKVTPQDMS